MSSLLTTFTDSRKFSCGSKGNEDGFMGRMPGYGQKATIQRVKIIAPFFSVVGQEPTFMSALTFRGVPLVDPGFAWKQEQEIYQ